MTDSNAPTGFPAPGRTFNTTHWSVVLLAGQEQSPQRAEALEKLCRTYWPPLFAFVRRKGFNETDAQDLTQAFFARLLERRDFDTVDPCRGKFRTFLLVAMQHFLANEWDRARAAKRGGGQAIFSLEELREAGASGVEPQSDLSPDKLFDLRWATTVLEQALAELGKEMATAGKARQFELLKTYLTGDPEGGDYAAVASQSGLTTQAIAVAVFRLRQRYRDLVRAEVAHTVSSPAEVEEELRHLFAVLSS